MPELPEVETRLVFQFSDGTKLLYAITATAAGRKAHSTAASGCMPKQGSLAPNAVRSSGASFKPAAAPFFAPEVKGLSKKGHSDVSPHSSRGNTYVNLLTAYVLCDTF